jgi:DNA-binding response OmpR family regulator
MTTLVVIKDDPSIADTRTAIFPEAWTVLAALHGSTGLDLVRWHIAHARPLDLMVVDIKLPGIVGGDTCTPIRARADSPDSAVRQPPQ